MKLTREDAYALKCALSKQPIPQNVNTSPMLALLLNSLNYMEDPDDWNQIQKMVAKNPEILLQIMQEDPAKPPVKPSHTGRQDMLYVPPLPKAAQLTDDAISAGEKVGQLLADGMAWATRRSPMTPHVFLEAGLLWAAGLLIARRCVLHLDFDDIYPHLYTLWVAPTTYYRKSTAFKALNQLVRQVAPHLILAAQSTPEALLGKLAGEKTANYEGLTTHQKGIEDLGARFAGQRGVLVDEATKLLLSGKKYLDGLPEAIMELYDAPDILERELRTDGKLVIYEPALSFLGATTPARLARSLTDTEWEDGLMARFALLTPTEEEVKREVTTTASKAQRVPADVLKRLKAIHDAFPAPPTTERRFTSTEEVKLDTRDATITPEALALFNAYADAMHNMTAPRAGLDERLRGNYGRFPVLMLKIGLILSVMDWTDAGDTANSTPTISLGHLARAQQITEGYRVSAHRLLAEVNISRDVKNEERILDFIAACGEKPPSAREILRSAGVRTRKEVESALDSLLDAGEIEESQRKTGGRPARVFRMAETYNAAKED